MSQQYSIAAARNNLPALVHAVEKGPRVELTRRGKPVAILLSISEYERLSGNKSNLWQAIEDFRQSVDLELLKAEEVYADVRDPSPGREPKL